MNSIWRQKINSFNFLYRQIGKWGPATRRALRFLCDVMVNGHILQSHNASRHRRVPHPSEGRWINLGTLEKKFTCHSTNSVNHLILKRDIIVFFCRTRVRGEAVVPRPSEGGLQLLSQRWRLCDMLGVLWPLCLSRLDNFDLWLFTVYNNSSL